MKAPNFRWLILYFVIQLLTGIPCLVAQEIVFDSTQNQQKLIFGFSKFIDNRQTINIEQIHKNSAFIKTNQSIPDFGWGKFRGWVKFKLRSTKDQNLWIQIHNPLFSELEYYVFVADSCLSHENYSFKNLNKNQFPTFRLKSIANTNYTIYLAGKAELNPIKFPIRILTDEGLHELDVKKGFEFGLLIGFSGLLIFLNTLIGVVFRIRVFWILSLFILNFSCLYAYQEGYLNVLFFESFFNFQYFIFAVVFFLNLTFVWALFRVYLSPNIKWRNTYASIILCASVLFILLLFSPLWYHYFSNEIIQSFGYGVRFLTIFANIFMLVAAFQLYSKVRIAKWYILGILPGMLSYIIPRFFNRLIDGIWLTLPQIYFLTVIWFTITMSIGFIILLAKNYIKIEEENSNTDYIQNNAETLVYINANSILSKREIEIIKAFSNGFTYQEISDALFISPHTVRTHIKNIYQKLEINSKAEAVKYVIENKL